jgi:hypothetical protein
MVASGTPESRKLAQLLIDAEGDALLAVKMACHLGAAEVDMGIEVIQKVASEQIPSTHRPEALAQRLARGCVDGMNLQALGKVLIAFPDLLEREAFSLVSQGITMAASLWEKPHDALQIFKTIVQETALLSTEHRASLAKLLMTTLISAPLMQNQLQEVLDVCGPFLTAEDLAVTTLRRKISDAAQRGLQSPDEQ